MDMEQLYSDVVHKLTKDRVAKGVGSISHYNGRWYFVIDAEKRWSVEQSQNSDEEQIHHVTFSSVGGAVEKGESIIEGLQREVMEEMNTKIEVFDSQDTYYIDTHDKVISINLEDDIRPFLIFEQRFSSPGPATVYLIYVFKTRCLSVPSPSSEIPAVFSTSLDDFKRLEFSMPLSEFYNSYDVVKQRELPVAGTISPALTPKILLGAFVKKLEEFMKLS
jgi:hypothetical protein